LRKEIVSVEDLSFRQVATIGVHNRGKEVRRMLLKSSSSMFDPKEFALAHLFLMIVMKIVKSSQSEYVKFLRFCSAASLAS